MFTFTTHEEYANYLISHMDDKRETICQCNRKWTTGYHGPSDMFAVSNDLKHVARRFDVICGTDDKPGFMNILTCDYCGSVLAVNHPEFVRIHPKEIVSYEKPDKHSEIVEVNVGWEISNLR